MGLDITAYSRLIPAPDAERDEDDYPVDYDIHWLAHPVTFAMTDRHFPGRTDGLIANMTYTYADSFGFRAGSYGGYGAWRRSLAEMAGYSVEGVRRDPPVIRPFIELINFSDCEGMIGPAASAKLARDFAEHQARAEVWATTMGDLEGGWWLESYNDWRRAFEMATDSGAVDFH